MTQFSGPPNDVVDNGVNMTGGQVITLSRIIVLAVIGIIGMLIALCRTAVKSMEFETETVGNFLRILHASCALHLDAAAHQFIFGT